MIGGSAFDSQGRYDEAAAIAHDQERLAINQAQHPDPDYMAANIKRFLSEQERRRRAEGSLDDALLLIDAQAEVIEEQRKALEAQAETLRLVEIQLADERAQAVGDMEQVADATTQLIGALVLWQASYPDLGDPHNAHERGRFQGECQACADEMKLLAIAQEIADELDRAGRDSGAEARGELTHEQPRLELSEPAGYAPASAPVQSPSIPQ